MQIYFRDTIDFRQASFRDCIGFAKSDSKAGAVLPLNINGRDFTITVEKEATD